MRRSLAILTTGIAALALSAAPVAARAFPFNEPYSGSGPEALCGLETVNTYAGTAIGRGKVDQAGNVTEFDIKNKEVAIWSLPSTGRSVTARTELLYKNFDFVDNGDGTQTSHQTTVGKSTWYDDDGALILKENGPQTVEVTIDFNVPPGADPVFTFVTLSSHGHHPDACPVLTEALGA